MLPLVSASVYQLDGDNFDRLVHRPSNVASFVKFYAPWCGHCQKLAPDWQAVEEEHESDALLVGSVDCSAGPNGRNPLCDTHQAMSLPTLKFFFPGDTKGEKYHGNTTQEELLEFASGLSKPCTPTEHAECPEEQKKLLDEYTALSAEELKSRVAAKTQEAEMAEMSYMYTMHMMQEAHQDKSLSEKKKKKKMKEFEAQIKSGEDAINEGWRAHLELRMMKAALRALEPPKPVGEKKKKKKKSKKKKAKDEV